MAIYEGLSDASDHFREIRNLADQAEVEVLSGSGSLVRACELLGEIRAIARKGLDLEVVE